MGHPQPGPTTVTTDNSTAVGLTKNTMVPKASKSMDMRFQWLKCRHAQQLFKYLWARVTKNRANYPSKHHPAKHCLLVRPWYVIDTTWALPPCIMMSHTKGGTSTQFNSIWRTYVHEYWRGCADLAVITLPVYYPALATVWSEVPKYHVLPFSR